MSPFGISPTIAYIRKIRWRISFANGRISKKNMRVRITTKKCAAVYHASTVPRTRYHTVGSRPQKLHHPLPKHHYTCSALESLISERIRPVK